MSWVATITLEGQHSSCFRGAGDSAVEREKREFEGGKAAQLGSEETTKGYKVMRLAEGEAKEERRGRRAATGG